MIILDEAHKARKDNDGIPNNLMNFMLEIANKTNDMILGTATPIQLNVNELICRNFKCWCWICIR